MARRVNEEKLQATSYTNLDIAKIIGNEFGAVVHGEKKGWYWKYMSYAVGLFSDIKPSEFLGNFSQTFGKHIYLSDRALKGSKMSCIQTDVHECRHKRQFYKDPFMAVKYLTNTAFRTKMEVDASLANLVLKVWNRPGSTVDSIIDEIIGHISAYGIKKVDTAVMRSMFQVHADIIKQIAKQGWPMPVLEAYCPEAAFAIKWLTDRCFVD
jgi:hypothetical protein